MAIPLELQVAIAASGLGVFQQVQQGIQATVTQTAAATGLGGLAQRLDVVAASAGGMTPFLFGVTKELQNLSTQSGVITPAALDTLAEAFEMARYEVIASSLAYQILAARGVELNAITASLTPTEWQLQAALGLTAEELRTKSLALQTTTQHTVELERATKRATAATAAQRVPLYQVWNAMNIMGSATQGLMMAFSALSGNVMGVGFSLIFLRFTLAPITLAVAALALAIGGTIKGLTFIGQAFESLTAGPLERIKAALVETWGYLAGPVWIRMILPLLATLADMAEAFRDIAAQVWLSAEVQRNWLEVGVLFSALMADLNSLFKEHGEMLRWLVRTGFITILNVIKGLIWTGRILMEVLLSLAGAWRALTILLKPVWDLLRMIGQALKNIGFSDALREAKGWSLDFPEIMKTGLIIAAGYLLGGPKGALLGALASLVGDLLIGLLPLDQGVKDAMHRIWDFTILGAAIGAFFGPAGIAIGAAVGTLIGILDEVFGLGIRQWFEENLPVIFSAGLIGAAIGSMIPGVGTAVGALCGAILGAFAVWFPQVRDAIESWFQEHTLNILKALSNMIEAVLTFFVTGPGQYLISPASREAIARQIEFNRAFMEGLMATTGPIPPRPAITPGVVAPSLFPGISGRAGVGTTVTVNITGNNIWNDQAVNALSVKVGDAVMQRVTGRYGIGIR